MIDWDNLIKNLKDGDPVTVDPSRWNMSNPEYKNIYSQWKEANFNMSAIRWTNYYPEKHFDGAIIDTIAKNLKIQVHRAWISKIDPGYFAPWHWDVDDNLEDYKLKGKVLRFSIFIGNPSPAHFFTTEDQSFSNTKKGTVYKWPNYKSWHAGANAGLKSKYMLHILRF